MSKRLTLEEVKEIVKEISGYDLLENEYRNKDTKMTCIDSYGYRYYSSLGNLKRVGKSSAFHSNNPYTIDNIRLWIKLNNRTDTLLSTNYISNGSKSRKDKLLFLCEKGHEFENTWDEYKNGSECLKCKREKGLRKSVKERFGYEILDDEIGDGNSKITYIDEDGYKYHYILNSVCSGRKASPFHINNPYTIDNIKLWIKLNNKTDILLSTEYTGSGIQNREDKLSFVCKNGHEFKIIWSEYKQGKGCSKCVRRYEDKDGYIKVVEEMYGDEYSLIGDYVNSQTKTLMKHNKCGYEWEVYPNSITQGHGCPKCSYKRGEEHYKWNPDLTDEDRKKNSSRLTQLGYKKWRGDVLGNGGNMCVVCGVKKSKNNKLVPHHLNSWDTHVDERFNVDNGVAICEIHHNEFHMMYGYGKNTKEQFEEYINDKKQIKSA